MSIVHRLEGCGWQVSEIKGVTPAGELSLRQLAIIHPGSDQVWLIELPLPIADDMGGQLQGQPPRKHVEVAGAMPPGAALAQFRNGG